MSVKEDQASPGHSGRRKGSPAPKKLPELRQGRKRSVIEPIKSFPIVGIGGSAGSLDALERFFISMPPDSGIAFVIVQHLDPTQKAMLADILGNFTGMPVREVEDGTSVEPDHVYIIPPNKDISVLNGRLLLFEPAKPRGQRMPVDYFFQSLAEDQGESAVGIILSGMGSDGELGIKMIKEHFGLTITQDPKSAQFDSMPKSAIASGLVDFVLMPEEMPEVLLGYTKRSGEVRRHPDDLMPEDRAENALQKIFMLLRSQTGHDFSMYKRSTVMRRIERRVVMHQLQDIGDYVTFMRSNPHESQLLFKELLISVTKFFRDPEAFEVLKLQVEKIVKAKKDGGQIRVWVPGCATGEEAYTIAILIAESLARLPAKGKIDVQIFGTDLDQEAIDHARIGEYYDNISADLSQERLDKYFIKKENSYCIRKEIREMVVFALHNVIKDPPFTNLDLICCRNLLIYFVHELQKKLLPVFHYSLAPGGILFLGSAENINGFTDIFAPVDSKWKIFRTVYAEKAVGRALSFPLTSGSGANVRPKGGEEQGVARHNTMPELFSRILLEEFTPPAALITPKGDILLVNGRTGSYLELSSGLAEMNIFKMAKNGLKFELNAAVQRAVAQKGAISAKNIRVRSNKDNLFVDITVKYIDEPRSIQGLLLVVFEESILPPEEEIAVVKIPASKKSTAVRALERELVYVKHQLETTTLQMETSLEDLKSTNEELQSTNEELQSINEEAITSREEMQSLNEELLTLNDQLQVKSEELSRANNDMRNLLDSTEIATIFLDNDLCIMRYTPQANKISNILPSDVGRSITDLALNIRHDNIIADIRSVLDRLHVREAAVETRDGRWYMMRILPYRTIDNFIAGVVLTFTDITEQKILEGKLSQALNYNENIVNTIREALLVLNPDLVVLSCNRSFEAIFQIPSAYIIGRPFFSIMEDAWGDHELNRLLTRITRENMEFSDYIVEHDFPKIGRRRLLLNARAIPDGEDQRKILLAIQDLSREL